MTATNTGRTSDSVVPVEDGSHARQDAEGARIGDSPNRWGGSLTQHLGLVTSAFLAVLSSLQIFGAAGWDTETAQAIVQAQGSSQVLTGTLLGVVGLLAPGVALVGALQPLLWFVKRRWVVPMSVSMSCAAVSLLLAYALSPVSLVAFAVVLSVGTVFRARRRVKAGIKDSPAESMERGWAGAGFLTVLSLYVLFAMPTAEPWLPSETVETAGGATRAMYVLDDDGDEWTLLDHDTRRLVVLDDDDITSRSLCGPTKSWLLLSVRDLVEGRPLPDCP